MSFTPGALTRWSANPQPHLYGLPQWWGYLTNDTTAQVSAADYFNLNIGLRIGGNSTFFIGDLIYCVCSNGIIQLQISALAPNILTLPSSISTITASVLAITGAQIDAMFTTPISILPAPAAGSMIVFNSATLNFTGMTTAFAGGGAINFEYGNIAAGLGVSASTTLAAATLIGFGTTNSTVTLTNTNAGNPSTGTAGLGLYLSNKTAVFTGGANSLTNIVVNYSIVPVA